MHQVKQSANREVIGADLSLIRHFVAVVEAGSFTRAAVRLSLSQSVVSRSVGRLEDTLGTALLQRTTRRLRLTPAGDALYAEAIASLDRLAVALDDARRIGLGANAALRVGVCQSTAADVPIVQRGLRSFQGMWPQVQLKLCATISAAQPAALRASELDIGIMQSSGHACAGLDWKILARSPLMVAVPTAWNLPADRLSLKTLRDRPWILPDPALAAESHAHALAILRSAGFEPRIGGIADDRLTAQIMLGCGLGAALVHARPEQVPSPDYDLILLKRTGADAFAETIVAWVPSARSEQIACLVECLREAADT